MPFLKRSSFFESRVKRLEDCAKKNGLKSTVVSPDYDKYVGVWKHDVKEGKGLFLTRRKKLYEGDWHHGYRHGFGVYSRKLKDTDIFILIYRGDWKKGHVHGFGESHCTDHYYSGFFLNGKRHGFGQMWYRDGSFYSGNWENNLRWGLGMLVRADGNRYEGNWERNLKHGRGRFFHLDSGQMQEGYWEDDVCTSSELVDIPYRQSAVLPTPHPVQPLCM